MPHPNWNLLPKETIQEFDKKGCLIVRNALNKKTVAHLLEVCDRLIDSTLKTNRQTRENGYYDGYRWLAPIDYRVQSESLIEKLDPPGNYLVGETLVKTEEYQTSGGETPLKPWCEQNDLPLVRPPVWEEDLIEMR